MSRLQYERTPPAPDPPFSSNLSRCSSVPHGFHRACLMDKDRTPPEIFFIFLASHCVRADGRPSQFLFSNFFGSRSSFLPNAECLFSFFFHFHCSRRLRARPFDARSTLRILDGGFLHWCFPPSPVQALHRNSARLSTPTTSCHFPF